MSSAVVASLLVNRAPSKSEVVALLRKHRSELEDRFGVESLVLFGDVAESVATPESDIDVLVEFRNPPTLRSFFDTQDFLEEVLGREVDLTTPEGMSERSLAAARQGEPINA